MAVTRSDLDVVVSALTGQEMFNRLRHWRVKLEAMAPSDRSKVSHQAEDRQNSESSTVVVSVLHI